MLHSRSLDPLTIYFYIPFEARKFMTDAVMIDYQWLTAPVVGEPSNTTLVVARNPNVL